MRRVEILLGVGFLLITVVIIREAFRLGFGFEAHGPAPGFVMFWLAIVMLITTIGALVKGWQMKKGNGFFLSIPAMWSAAWVALTSVIFVVLIQMVGVYIAIFLYAALFSAWLGKHRWYAVVIFSILIPVVIYLGFEKGLMIPLPKSPLYGPGVLPF